MFEILERLFDVEEAVSAIITHKSIPHYIFYKIFRATFYDFIEQLEYVDLIIRIVSKSDFVTSTDRTNHSTYITGIINTLMAELIFYKQRMEKNAPFMQEKLFTETDLQELTDKIVDLFTLCVDKPHLAKNFGICLRENNFDLFFRFLLYQFDSKCYFQMVRLACAISMLVRREDCEYFMPPCYRFISLLWLKKEYANPDYLCTIAFMKVMKYFFYTEGQHQIFQQTLESVLMGIGCSADGYKSYMTILDFWLFNKSIIVFILEDCELEDDKYQDQIPDEDEDLYDFTVMKKDEKMDNIYYLSPGLPKPYNPDEDEEDEEKKPKEDPKNPEIWGYDLIYKKSAEISEKRCYAFESNKNNQFEFWKNTKGACGYCCLFKGFYCIETEILIDQAYELYRNNNVEPYEFTNHTEFAAVDLFFNVFQIPDQKFFIDYGMNFLFKMLVNKNLDHRVKCAWILYITHQVRHDKSFNNILLAAEFIECFWDYLMEFFKNFELITLETHVKQTGFASELKVGEKKTLEYESIMDPVTRHGTNEPKKTRTLVIGDMAGGKGMTVDLIQRSDYNDCVWNPIEKRFCWTRVSQAPKVIEAIQNYNRDDHYDSGIYTVYFARQHTVYHLSLICKEMLKQCPLNGKKTILKKLADLPLQIIEISIIFNNCSEAFIAKRPFLPDSECWDDIKAMLKECSGVFQDLLMLMLTNDYKMLQALINALASNEYFVKGFMDLLGKFGSHLYTVSFLTNVLLICENLMQRDPETITYDTTIIKPFLEALVKHLVKFDNNFRVIIQKNMDLADKAEFYDETALVIGFKTSIISLQIQNQGGTENLIKGYGKDFLQLVSPIISFLVKILKTGFIVKNKTRTRNRSKTSTSLMNYDEFCTNFIECSSLFCWWINQKSVKANLFILGTDLFQNLCQNVEKYSISNDGLFCLSCIMMNAVKNLEKIETVETRFPNFSEVLNNFLMHSMKFFTNAEHVQPLLKALRLILTTTPYERVRFMKLLTPINDLLKITQDMLKQNDHLVNKNVITDDKFELSLIENDNELINPPQVNIKNRKSFADSFQFHDDKQDALILKQPSFRATELECRKIIEILKGGQKAKELDAKMAQYGQAKEKPGQMALETMKGLKAREDLRNEVESEVMNEFQTQAPRNKAIKEKLLDPFPVSFNTSMGQVKTGGNNSLEQFSYFTDAPK